MFFHILHYNFFHRFVVLSTHLLDMLATNIGSHHDNGIFKVHGSTLSIGQATVIQYLQQNIEYVRMGFFHFIQKNHAVWFAADLLSQVTAFFVANIAGRCTD